jgi:hypothetical protein
MLPPSKTEIEETIEKAANSASERQKAENKKDTSEIALEIKTFNDAYQSERKKPDKTDKVKRALDVATLVLLFATALFTALA